MNKKFSGAVFCAVFSTLVFCSGASGWQGDDKDKSYRIRGAGQDSCGDFIKEKQKGASVGYARYIDWVEGYMSAYSVFVPDTAIADSKETKVLMWWLSMYCKSRPQDKFSQAVLIMISELSPGRSPHRSDK